MADNSGAGARRILHLGKYYPPVPGGMERFLGDLVEAQRAAGHEVAVLVHDQGGARLPEEPAWLMRCPVWLRLAFAPISPSYPFWLYRTIRKFAPDVLHIHLPNLSVYWVLLLPCARRLPWVIQWQSDVEPSRFKRSLRLLYPYYRIFERALLARAEVVVVASPPYLASSQPLRPWREKCHVLPLGVDPGRLPEVPAAAGLWQEGRTRILSIGRLTYYKGFETLIRAVAACPGLELAIVGDGEDRPLLEHVLAELGNPSWIRLLGQLDDAACRQWLASCDIFCLPSRERTEAFGIVLLEAMRYGKPVLAGDIPGSGVAWLVQEGGNGVRVSPEDVPAWRQALLALAADPPLRERLGSQGRSRFFAEFDIAGIVPRLDEIYRQVMAAAQDEGPLPTASRQQPLIVIPALNEAQTVGDIIARVRQSGFPDVLVVDDGSTDGTAAVAARAGALVLRAPLPQGAWGAMQTGIRYAVRQGYPSVITLDADGQHEPAYLESLIAASVRADVVIGAYPERGSFMRRLAWRWFRLLTGFSLEDLTSGLRHYNARACRLLAGEEATLVDYQDIGVLLLLHRAGLRIAEVPVVMLPRRSGPSRIFSSWWTVARYMAETTVLCFARWGAKSSRPAKRSEV